MDSQPNGTVVAAVIAPFVTGKGESTSPSSSELREDDALMSVG